MLLSVMSSLSVVLLTVDGLPEKFTVAAGPRAPRVVPVSAYAPRTEESAGAIEIVIVSPEFGPT